LQNGCRTDHAFQNLNGVGSSGALWITGRRNDFAQGQKLPSKTVQFLTIPAFAGKLVHCFSHSTRVFLSIQRHDANQ
jgi:hypothetical protein